MFYDLHFSDTETLLGQVLDDEPLLPALLTAIRETENWEHFLDIRLYDLYRAKFAVLVSADSPPEAIQKFSEHLSAARGVLTRNRRSELPEKLAVINDLLKDQLIRLDELRPSEVAKRTHVQPMLRCLWESNGASERSVLREELGLAEANLTRVLNLAQTAALITRKRVAKNVQVSLTPIGSAICEKLFPKKKDDAHSVIITEDARTYVCKFEPQGAFLLIRVAQHSPPSAWDRNGRQRWKFHSRGSSELTMKLPNHEVVRTFEACSGRVKTVPVSLQQTQV
jgi:DNA-binding MarR family transcriptional regulator